MVTLPETLPCGRGELAEGRLLLVILGAGASYDSAPSYRPDTSSDAQGGHRPSLADQYRPPLADQLFDDRPNFSEWFMQFPECLPLITNLRHRDKGTSVERVLEAYADEVGAYPVRQQHLMAIRYALQMLLGNCISSCGVLPKVLLTARSLGYLRPGNRPGCASQVPSGAPGCCSPQTRCSAAPAPTPRRGARRHPRSLV